MGCAGGKAHCTGYDVYPAEMTALQQGACPVGDKEIGDKEITGEITLNTNSLDKQQVVGQYSHTPPWLHSVHQPMPHIHAHTKVNKRR